MIRYLLLLLLPLTLFGQSQKISDMTSATSLTGSEYVPIVQTTNKKATVGLLRGWTSLGTAGQLLKVNSGATALEFFTPSYLTALTNGNGTTANGSAVDLGGVQSGNIDIDPAVAGTYEYRIGYTRQLSRIVGYTDFEIDFRSDNSGYTQGSSLLLQNSNSQIRAYGSGYDRRINFSNSGVILDLGSDANEDSYVRRGGYLTRIPVGSNGQVWTVTGGTVGWAAPSGGSGLTVGTSTITSGTNTRVLYNNSGVLGEYTVSGSGNVAMTTSPTFTTPLLGTPTSGTLTNTTGYLFNNLAAATGANTINNAANAQEWQWNTLAAGTGLLLSSSSTAAASNTNTVFRVNQTGANATSTQTTYSGYFSNTKTGTSSTNIAGYFTASGGTTNNAIVIGGGNVTLNQAANQTILKSGGTLAFGVSDFNTLSLVVQNTNRLSINGSSGAFVFTTNAATSGAVIPYSFNDFARTGQTASTETHFVNWTPNTTQFATGAMTTLRAYKMNPATYSFVGASTITNAFTLWVDKPVASTNATITNNWSAGFSGNINVDGSIVAGAVTTLNTGSIIHAKGTGTGTNKTILIENSPGTDLFYVEDDGSVAVVTTPTKDNAATQVLTRNSSSGEIEYKDAGVTYSATNIGNEMVSYNHGTLGSATTSSVSIHVNAYYSNSTTLFADVTVVAVKTDGTASAHAKVSGRFRKDSGGTFNLDENGTATTSDAAIIADVDLEINGTNPSIKVTMGAASGNYKVGHSANTTWTTN